MPDHCFDTRTSFAPRTYLASIGQIFATFDERTQDSGNVSYGVAVGDQRYFVKTAGDPQYQGCLLPHAERVALLRNAIELRRSCSHPALPALHRVVGSPHGPLLAYEWVTGELLKGSSREAQDPASAFCRLVRLPVEDILQMLDAVYQLHAELASSGWIAVDFYDSSLLYDFEARRLKVMDLDHYHRGPFTNTMGRMFGSTRFMAPEEFELGACIDERTTVFTLGRAAAVFLTGGSLEAGDCPCGGAILEVIQRACQTDRAQRFASVATFHETWRRARGKGSPAI